MTNKTAMVFASAECLVRGRHQMLTYTYNYMTTIVATAVKEKRRAQCERLNGGPGREQGRGCPRDPRTDAQL